MQRKIADILLRAAAGAAVIAAALPLLAADWPTWGHDASRNMVSPETGLPDTVKVGKVDDDTGALDLKSSQHIAWAARLGSQAYGNPVVAGGRVFVGTNNAKPRDEKYQGDYGILLCLDEKTGKLIWQLAAPKLAGGRNVDWEECGICSSPAVDGDRVYVVTNRCEVLALDVAGMADGNEGPFKEEAQYTAGPGKPSIEQGPTDADIVWRYDMRHELGVFPHFQTASNPLVVGDRLYITTSNGVDWSDKHIPSPDAPALICLDKKTGKLLGAEKSGISARTLYCNWSAPAFGNVGGKPTLVFGGGDGFLYGFDPAPTAGGELTELWRIDCNPPEYRVKAGKPIKYRDGKGPSEVIATPVVYGDKVYVPIGQDPEHGPGSGALNCVSVSFAGEKATAKIDWRNVSIGRSMSTVSIVNGLLFEPEFQGMIHCIDPATGAEIWSHDAESNVWGSATVADGKVFIGDESGDFLVLAAEKTKRVIGKSDMGGAVFSSAVAANGAVYIATGTQLFKLVK